jgi:hypothetical protein
MSRTSTPARWSAKDIIVITFGGALAPALRSPVPVAGKCRKKPALSRAGAGPEPGPTQVESRAGAGPEPGSTQVEIKASPLLAALATAGNAGAASQSARHRPESVAPLLCGNAGCLANKVSLRSTRDTRGDEAR